MREIAENHDIIPIFFACDEGFIKYTCVALRSLIANASQDHQYHVHILCTDISEKSRQKVYALATEQFTITFEDVSRELAGLQSHLHIRDYYSITTYFRVFIPNKFPEYHKVLYLDSDMIILKDIAELYDTELEGACLGVVRDQVIGQTEIFGRYAEEVLEIDRNSYFNAGMMLINCDYFRQNRLLDQFEELINTYIFVFAQDQDYLNVLCKDQLRWLEPRWNAQVYGKIPCEEKNIAVIHYNLAYKPWHYRDHPLAEYFWQYAEETADYELLLYELQNYTEENQQRDTMAGENLFRLAMSEIDNENNYRRLMKKKSSLSSERQIILERIAQYEREGRFDEDVEEDPPTIPLLPENIDYLNKTWREQMRTRGAFGMARWFMRRLIYKKQLVVKEIRGIENLKGITSGAVITCNHFSALDSFVIHMVYEQSKQKKRKLYRVIREGNYTNFPGFYGYLMRNCNTLPLSSNYKTMKKFMEAVSTLLQKGHFVLIYPEQSMWWNYRKPKPLKSGAYKLAAGNHVPVIPCFITMKDTEVLDDYGFPVQEYTVHVGAPIWPEDGRPKAENAMKMQTENYALWKKIYEETYQIPLEYECES